MSESLHEQLLAQFLASAQTPREVAAANEIRELRKKIRELEAELKKMRAAPKPPGKGKGK